MGNKELAFICVLLYVVGGAVLIAGLALLGLNPLRPENTTSNEPIVTLVGIAVTGLGGFIIIFTTAGLIYDYCEGRSKSHIFTFPSYPAVLVTAPTIRTIDQLVGLDKLYQQAKEAGRITAKTIILMLAKYASICDDGTAKDDPHVVHYLRRVETDYQNGNLPAEDWEYVSRAKQILELA